MTDAFLAWMKKEDLFDRLAENEVKRLSGAFMAGILFGIRNAP
jgi:hypothetical protein